MTLSSETQADQNCTKIHVIHPTKTYTDFTVCECKYFTVNGSVSKNTKMVHGKIQKGIEEENTKTFNIFSRLSNI